MLQMTCSHCDGLIKSILLAEVQEIECAHCKQIVPVRNVVVSTKNFTMHREDLINRVSHYKKLLRDVEDEVAQAGGNENNTDRAKNSSDNLRASLKDLLLAARDNFRLNMSYDLFVQIDFGINKRLARLANISSTGAAIELVDRGPVPENHSVIKFQLLLPGSRESLSFSATVVWSKKLATSEFSESITMGVKFQNLDQETRACIWDFIVTSETSGRA